MADSIQYHRVSDTPELVISDALYSDYQFEPHYHLDYHIGLVIDGVQRQQFQGQSVLLGPGRISVMPPGEIHDGSGYDNSAYRMKTFRLSPALLDDYAEDIFESNRDHDFGGAMVENDLIAQRLLSLHRQIQQTRTLSSVEVEELWLSLMAPLLSQLCAIKPKSVNGGLSTLHWQQVKDYCHANLGSKITLEQLAALCGLSRYQFLRRFEKTCGLTPRSWLIRLRLEHACLLLRRSDQSIADIAATVGFYDQSHFNRAFRLAYGVAPSAY
ncbi:AraC family transcriptional regulator [Motiliproteus coralliicola]|uniref:AraC family transcriptional regulator n=1 Tax=Motiliproteus coralliicola TaxID=2283196 RepID=A0A369WGB3_9GAMM|nr:AraC family transcriptional regulator [Motiliproteus coralliicola]RDE19724.1 AraC family transcriptional regulator [Motiliproteus coralliicola]